MNESVDPVVDGLVRYGLDGSGHEADKLTRFRVDLAYEGTDFFGWAKQPGLRTVQGEFLEVLTTVFGESSDDFGLRVAGRTDAGVHALRQVAHFDLDQRQLKRLGRSNDICLKLNTLLPTDIRVHEVTVAPAGFDARFSAISRRYVYRIADAASVKNPLQGRYTLWVPKPLKAEAMQDAALELIGLREFASFCRPRPGGSTIRELKQIIVRRVEEDFNVIEIELLADAFCHNMVRSIVGALISVGLGKTSRAQIAETLARETRAGSFKVVLPHGLQLVEIGYPADALLGFQAEMTKNLRTSDEL
jgi:tRNA pseudouridine38-40 synthase